jgi:hypothetical protein
MGNYEEAQNSIGLISVLFTGSLVPLVSSVFHFIYQCLPHFQKRRRNIYHDTVRSNVNELSNITINL